MKKIIALFLCVCSLTISAQDSTKTTKHKRKIYNEVGVNATLLLRQILNSSSSITLQPYNLTYKLIAGKWAARVGLGLAINNSSSSSTSYNDNSNIYTSPPDQLVPSYNKTNNYYFRAGAEYRVRVGRKLLVYGGIDVVGQFLNAKTQNSEMENNLPNFYNYRKTNTTTTGTGLGIGPVIGIQFYCTRRFSIYTEIPLYYMSTTQNFKSSTYENYLDNNTGPYYSHSNYGSTQHNQNKAFSISIPATLYLAVKF